ncbi:MAG: ATPase domain-containing protein [Candidatus Diapherotrites archaeon]
MERIPTGIPGLDSLIEGGFPQGRTMLLAGGTGTGKTIFSLQYLFEGAKKYKEPGLYVTLDERPELIREDVERFGWELEKLEQENLLHIVDASVAKIGIPSKEAFALPETGFDLDKLLLEILRASKKVGAKRVVVDSLQALGLKFDEPGEARKAVLKLSYLLAKIGATSILTSEVAEGDKKFGTYGVEEYVADAVISLRYLEVGVRNNRLLHIRKMRATKHSEFLHPLEITEKGITVHNVDE